MKYGVKIYYLWILCWLASPCIGQDSMDRKALAAQLSQLLEAPQAVGVSWDTLAHQSLQVAEAFLNEKYDYAKAIVWFKQAIEIYENQLHSCIEEKPLAERAYIGLAMSYHHIGNHMLRDRCMNKAKSLLALPEKFELYTENFFEPNAALYFIVDGYRSYLQYEESRRNAGSIAQQENFLPQAEHAFQKSLEIAQVYGTSRVDQTHAQQGLGTVYEFLGKSRLAAGDMSKAQHYIQQSIESFNKALASREKLLGTTHPHYARSLHKLARNYALMGYMVQKNNEKESQEYYKKADLLYQEALAIFEQTPVAKNQAKRQELENEYQRFKKDTSSVLESDSYEYNQLKKESHMQSPVEKRVLKNGMTVLVRRVDTVPKVSLQLWYDVGSKDEKSGEKGIAHLIEHMIFKGTEGKDSLNLSESDINVITHRLSGSCNAFTWYDYTGYLFNLPAHTWHEALPIMADCMTHCAFKEDHLSSEMKAVIQELKMRRDKYTMVAAEALMSSVFADHPYHYPIIGYKQDLWHARAALLRAFYKKHYCPNNATLVIVGDVNVEKAFALVEKYFGSIPANPAYNSEKFPLEHDIVAKSVTLYRDIQQPTVMFAFEVPGMTAKLDNVLEVGSLALGSGKGSRLRKKIVDELQLATSLGTFNLELFDSGLFFIAFEPKRLEDIDKIAQIILAEIEDIAKNGLSELELTRAAKKVRMNHYNLLEDTESQAYEIGKFFLATGDENYVFTSVEEPLQSIQTKLKKIYKNYLRPSVMHRALVLPLSAQDKPYWTALQKESDDEDTRILSARVRTTPVEPPSYAQNITVSSAPVFSFPKPTIATLANGIKVFSYANPALKKIDLVVDLKAKSFYEPMEFQGLYNFVTSMMIEGTEHYTAAQLAQELESRGMSLSINPGTISMSMLSDDLEKGLELLMEVLTKATFIPNEIEKVREQILVDIKNFWDNPSSCAGQIVREHVYKGHPYCKNSIGTLESIKKINREDLVAFYKKYISPSGAKLAIVGDIGKYNLHAILNKTLGTWQGPLVSSIQFPALGQCVKTEILHPMERDQVVLCFASPSIERKNPDFDKLTVFDQILGGGVLGSMSSRLFDLREQSGLFYSINGSLVSSANEQPGMVLVKTMVSLDRLKEAQELIINTLRTVADTITPEELAEAKNAITNSLVLNFESNEGIANAFLFVDRYGFPLNYFDTRAQKLEHITIADVQAAVKRILRPDELAIFKIGRVK